MKTYTDLCSGYNAFWKNSLEKVKLDSADGFENEPLFLARVGKAKLKVTEVGYTERSRISEEIKEQSWRQCLKAIKSILRKRFFG